MPTKKPRSRKSKPAKKNIVKVTRTSKSIHITYSDPRHVVPHLMDLVSEFTEKQIITEVALDEDVLGTDAAKRIVSDCADSTCWTCTLGDVKADSMLFQGCVYGKVRAEGFLIARDQIPASQDTRLYTVVIAIQGAKKE